MVVNERFLFVALVTSIFIAVLSSCSEDLSNTVDDILLTVDKNVALSEGDTVRIMTEVHNNIDERLTGIPLKFFANDNELPGPIFLPTEKGDFIISARYEDIVSQKQLVEVISLEDNITSLDLVYDGNPLLTTEDWSVSGSFSFEVQVDNLNFEVETNDIDLLMNGSPVSQRSHFHFDQAGSYEFEASFNNLRSNPVVIEVREKLAQEELNIPVVFHFSRLDPNIDGIRRLLDTLNSSFNEASFSVEDVKDGFVNPNAVDMNLRFVLATEGPDGSAIFAPGVNVISDPVSGNLFSDIAMAHTWDPEAYVNIWISDGQFEIEDDIPSSYVFYGRGEVSQPRILQEEIPGLITLEKAEIDSVAGIILNAGSIFGEHPDYVVATMAHYFGLLTTFEFDCRNEGDYCTDTPTFDFTNPVEAPTNFFWTCDGKLFRPSNFLSINRNYRDFTYDQALRVREVIRHAISRPGGDD